MDFKFADIGEGIHEGVILEWKVKLGDNIEEGDTIVIIETDKVNAEIPSPLTGVIKKLGPPVGEVIHVGETLAVIEDGEGEPEQTDEPVEAETQKEEQNEATEEKGAGVVGSIEVSNDLIAASTEETDETEPTKKRVLATPVARKIAKDLGVDIKTIKGTGVNGRVMKADIYKAAETKTTVADVSSTVVTTQVDMPTFDTSRTRREKVSKLRETIAKNMSLSKTIIPHTTVMDEVNVESLVQFRNNNKEMAKEEGVHLTYMPLIVKALAKTLKDFPIFNSSYDHNSLEIVYKNYMNIGIAVDTPNGLIVPNIKDADQLSVFEIARKMSDLKERATTQKITLEDLRDGTISVTNYGVFDSTFGAPVIKHPEVAIIGVGRISKKPVVINDEIVVQHVLPLSLSIDHRVIDGGDAGRFLKSFKRYLQNPMLLLLG